MYRIGICDDNGAVVKELERYLNEIQEGLEYRSDIHTFTDADDFMDDFEEDSEYDILFLDIELVTCNGIDIAKAVMQKHPETLIIFITAYHQYIYDSFQVRPVGFLEKPIEKDMVEKTLARAIEIMDDLPTFNYSFKGRQYRICLKKIAYLESRERKIVIGQNGGNGADEFYGKLDEIEKEIGSISSYFCRISQSVLINMRYIKAISFTAVTMEVNGKELEFGISRKYKDIVRERYMEFMKK